MIAQSASLFASLIAIGRRQAHSRLDLLLYQAVGLIAAVAVFYIWQETDPVAAMLAHEAPVDFVHWWGMVVDARTFLLLSLASFTGWTLLGCYRQMRLELKMRNGALVWVSFLAFIGLYVAGFDVWLSPNMKNWDAAALRLFLAATTYGFLTYVMVLLEPKDRVQYRWMLERIRAGRLQVAFSGIQAWMMSYGATFLVGVILAIRLITHVAIARAGAPFILAALGFVTRDVWLFVLMQTLPGRRRGDLGALAILFALYILTPAILSGLGAKGLLLVFIPQISSATWFGVAAAWVQGVAVASAALARLALVEPTLPRAPASPPKVS